MEVSQAVQSSLQSMFSPGIESSVIPCESTLHWDAGGIWADFTAKSATDDSDDSSDQGQDHQTCNISDYTVSDMIITGLSLDGETAIADANTSVNKCVKTSTLFDMICSCAGPGSSQCAESSHEAMKDEDESGLYVSMDQLRSCKHESDTSPCLIYDEDQSTSAQRSFMSLLDSVSNCPSTAFPTTVTERKSVTLVLDLDETLVHSSFEHSDDADFTFLVLFEMKEHTVYVRQRPYLRVFLEKVSEMFEIVIFTASQSIYAKQLLDILDPDGKYISRRFYRESCTFSNGCYTKDLTVIGPDLAKLTIIDNTPEVFQLQVNNGIPIKSWFDDPSDRELLSLLPLLETLVNAEDVRPIIAKKFGSQI